MLSLENFTMDYVSCEGHSQYDDTKTGSHIIVDARYIEKPGFEKYPDICALPNLCSNQELIQLTSKSPSYYRREDVAKMTPLHRKEGVLSLQNAVYPLEHIFDIAYAVNSVLITSYISRESLIFEVVLPDSDCHVVSLRAPLSSRAFCFLLTGVTGCGKTVAISQIKNLYPAGIRHYTDRYEYVQIPILMSTSFVGNMSELMTSFAERIDEILDTGTFHADRMRTRGLGHACAYLKQLIKRYHIGLLIIDEIQFMRFGSGHSSFENLISIAEETGVALGLVGNEEVNAKLARFPRIMSRIMLHRIEVSFHNETSISFFEAALQNMWEFQWTKEYTPLTQPIKAQLTAESMYNIALLKALLIRIQYEAIKKMPSGGITPEYIHALSEKHFSEIKSILYEKSTERERAILNILKTNENSILSDIAQSEKASRLQALQAARAPLFSEKNQWKLERIITILTAYYEHTESAVKRALSLSLKEDPHLQEYDVHRIVDIINTRLDLSAIRTASGTKKKKAISQQDIDMVMSAVGEPV